MTDTSGCPCDQQDFAGLQVGARFQGEIGGCVGKAKRRALRKIHRIRDLDDCVRFSRDFLSEGPEIIEKRHAIVDLYPGDLGSDLGHDTCADGAGDIGQVGLQLIEPVGHERIHEPDARRAH